MSLFTDAEQAAPLKTLGLWLFVARARGLYELTQILTLTLSPLRGGLNR